MPFFLRSHRPGATSVTTSTTTTVHHPDGTVTQETSDHTNKPGLTSKLKAPQTATGRRGGGGGGGLFGRKSNRTVAAAPAATSSLPRSRNTGGIFSRKRNPAVTTRPVATGSRFGRKTKMAPTTGGTVAPMSGPTVAKKPGLMARLRGNTRRTTTATARPKRRYY